MLPKFYTSFFSRTYLRDNLGPRLLCLFKLKDSNEAFCCSPSDQKAKISVVEDSGHINVPVIILLVTAKALRTYAGRATF